MVNFVKNWKNGHFGEVGKIVFTASNKKWKILEKSEKKQ